ncbi:hypothetical protein ACHAPU_006260 [Fusarium lateritium]
MSGVDGVFDDYLRTSSDSGFSAMLSKIFSFRTDSTRSEMHRFQAREARLYFLLKPDEMFQKLCDKEDFRRYLEREQENCNKTYFITGYRTLTDATLVNERSQRCAVNAQGEIPSGTLLGGDPSGLLNISTSGKREHAEDSSQNMVCRDERIYAVCCQKVKLITVKGHFDKAKLRGKPHWTSFEANRSSDTTLTVASILGDNDEEANSDGESDDENEEHIVRTWNVRDTLAFEAFVEQTST